MKVLKPFVLAAITAAALALIVASPASATFLTGESGTLGSGTELKSEAEGTTILHPPIGDIECKKSSVSGKTTNEGGEGEEKRVEGNIESLSFTECNATVTVLTKGTLTVEGTGSEYGKLRSSGTEVTVEFGGFHCIFKTSNTEIGTVTGSTITSGNATFDIKATIPRTGGRSGAFCGSTAQWTGSYKINSPTPLYIDDVAGEVLWGKPLTFNVGEEDKIAWTNKSKNAVTVTGDANTDNTVVETKGKQCGNIAANGGECETRIVKCLKKGVSKIIIFAGTKEIGKALVECD